MRIGLGTIIYLIVGVFVASDHAYLDHINTFSQAVSAALAVTLWPLILLNVNLHVHVTSG